MSVAQILKEKFQKDIGGTIHLYLKCCDYFDTDTKEDYLFHTNCHKCGIICCEKSKKFFSGLQYVLCDQCMIDEELCDESDEEPWETNCDVMKCSECKRYFIFDEPDGKLCFECC
jgi:hypothetical protein